MQKIILFSSVLALLGLCACSSNTYTLEQLAKAQEIAKDISPDELVLSESSKYTQTLLIDIIELTLDKARVRN